MTNADHILPPGRSGSNISYTSRGPAAPGVDAAVVSSLAVNNNNNNNNVEEQLSNLLSSPSFSVASYLNLALDTSLLTTAPQGRVGSKEEDEDEFLQRRMAELALQLQLQTQACHDEIGRIGAELRAIVPRCAADVARIGAGLDGMRIDAEALLEASSRSSSNKTKAKAKTIRRGTSVESKGEDHDDDSDESNDDDHSEAQDDNKSKKESRQTQQQEALTPLQTLSTLHALKSNLALTKSILEAASSWDVTLSSIPPLLSSQNFTEAVAALTKLQNGQYALRNMPGQAERLDAISKIRSQIEVLLKPQLLHALQRMDTRLGPLQQCVTMYGVLGKIDKLKEEYVKQRPGNVHRAWFAYSSSNTSSTTSKKSLGSATTQGGAGTEGDEGERKKEEMEENEEGGDDNPATAFVSWLPQWYDEILALLSEERRRSSAVFGTDLAPEVIARVLGECFRPLLPSFRTRLARMCSADIDESDSVKGLSSSTITSSSSPSTTKTSGSLESICAAYEATLQFLSLAYEQMAGLDSLPEAGGGSGGAAISSSSPVGAGSSPMSVTTSALTPVEIQRLIESTFAMVASPFAPYQEHFAKLELRHSGVTATMVARDVQGAVSGRDVGATLESLQDATDRLGGLAPFMFPLAEAAVARFELLNCGYNAPGALSTIDTLLSNHVDELAIAIGTLSATMTADENRLAEGFDEQHVLCALEVLKIAGSFRRDLRAFEGKTRDRLRALCGRMAASIAREEEIKVAASVALSGGGGKRNSLASVGSSFALPDSLSAVEVEAMLARAVCGSDDGHEKSLDILRRLAGSEKDGSVSTAPLTPLFPDSNGAMARLSGGCHAFVFDVCFAVPLRSLRKMPSLSVWREGARGGEVESYGILPQQYITQVGEHMLSLVQALEPFASNEDALSLANEVMGGVRNVAVQQWREFTDATGSVDADEEDVITYLMIGKNLSDHVVNHTENSFEEDEAEDEEEEDEAAKAVTAFCNEWLYVVGSAVTGRLLERTLRIQHLSPRGCEHLQADINYLINVFAALGVAGHPHPLLGHFAGLVTMDANELRDKILSRDRSNPGVNAIRAAEVRLALTRGIAVS